MVSLYLFSILCIDPCLIANYDIVYNIVVIYMAKRKKANLWFISVASCSCVRVCVCHILWLPYWSDGCKTPDSVLFLLLKGIPCNLFLAAYSQGQVDSHFSSSLPTYQLTPLTPPPTTTTTTIICTQSWAHMWPQLLADSCTLTWFFGWSSSLVHVMVSRSVSGCLGQSVSQSTGWQSVLVTAAPATFQPSWSVRSVGHQEMVSWEEGEEGKEVSKLSQCILLHQMDCMQQLTDHCYYHYHCYYYDSLLHTTSSIDI